MIRRWAIGIISVVGLLTVYLVQNIDAAALFDFSRPLHRFLFNRTVRYLLNDLFMIGIIYALFRERKYLIFSLWVQLAGVIFFLLPYYILKIHYPSYNGPLISYLHRLVLNPTLLLLLIPAFYYQQSRTGRPVDR